MKRLFVLAAGLLCAAILCADSAHAQFPFNRLNGNTYHVDVALRTNPAARFCDCMTFFKGDPDFGAAPWYSCMLIEGMGRPQVYATWPLEGPDGWQTTYSKRAVGACYGVAPTGTAPWTLGISFAGEVTDDGSLIWGDAVNEYGGMFLFDGYLDPDCSPQTCQVGEDAPAAQSPAIDPIDPWSFQPELDDASD